MVFSVTASVTAVRVLWFSGGGVLTGATRQAGRWQRVGVPNTRNGAEEPI